MDLLVVDELLTATGITEDFLKNLHEHNLISKPLSGTSEDTVYNAAVVNEIKHILQLQSLGYDFNDIAKILKVTDYAGMQTKKVDEKTCYYTVGEVANKLSLTRRTLDFWIEKGLIQPSTTSSSGYRLFSDNSVRFIEFISDLQTIGFTLEQIKSITETIDEEFKPLNENYTTAMDTIQEKINDNERAIKSLKSSVRTIQKNSRSLKRKEVNNQ
jgi:MerR family mercuric resistance operon transcriptional regulator